MCFRAFFDTYFDTYLTHTFSVFLCILLYFSVKKEKYNRTENTEKWLFNAVFVAELKMYGSGL